MNRQVILAVIFGIGFVIAGVFILSGGNLPGLGSDQYKAIVKLTGERGWIGSASIKIKEVAIERGYNFSVGIGPFLWAWDYKLEVMAVRGGQILDRKYTSISIDRGGSTDMTVSLSLDNRTDAEIIARMYYGSQIESEDRYSIQ